MMISSDELNNRLDRIEQRLNRLEGKERPVRRGTGIIVDLGKVIHMIERLRDNEPRRVGMMPEESQIRNRVRLDVLDEVSFKLLSIGENCPDILSPANSPATPHVGQFGWAGK